MSDERTYAFVSHASACEALRTLSSSMRRWPPTDRPLPAQSSCVTTQRSFKRLCEVVDLEAHGIVTRPVDLIVPSTQGRSQGKCARLHIWSRTLPKRSLVRLEERLLTSGPELTIMQLCGMQARLDSLLDAHVQAVHAERDVLDALSIEGHPVVDHPLHWERMRRLVSAALVACEFAGTYRLGATGVGAGALGVGAGASYHQPRLMTLDSLRRMAEGLGSTSMESRTLRVVGFAFDGSASPMETALALLLTLPVAFGGFGLPRPRLNAELDVSGLRGILARRDVIMPDMLWEEQRVALEYDSAEFHADGTRSRQSEDALRANVMTALGYSLFRATDETVRSMQGVEMLARQLAAALGVALEPPPEVEELRRRKLFSELMPRREDR